MNEQLVLISIGLVVAVVILWPLFRGRGAGMEPDRLQDLSPAASEQLAELELDRSMGRVSEQDYARFRDELEASGPAVTPEILPATRDESLQKAEALVRRWKQAPRATCKTCGVRPEPEAAFCSNCGAGLGGGA
jgi:cytochrome c-type biogenesis protein CcmI